MVSSAVKMLMQLHKTSKCKSSPIIEPTDLVGLVMPNRCHGRRLQRDCLAPDAALVDAAEAMVLRVQLLQPRNFDPFIPFSFLFVSKLLVFCFVAHPPLALAGVLLPANVPGRDLLHQLHQLRRPHL
eukprot:GABV01002836.1.p1 GENE.GABV01002836.1~~GABV01002836.1.p1  ORF type:complete len:127 (-),score=22.62 GABV01002836.1:139-519(-)